jgi:hypothetical protein
MFNSAAGTTLATGLYRGADVSIGIATNKEVLQCSLRTLLQRDQALGNIQHTAEQIMTLLAWPDALR